MLKKVLRITCLMLISILVLSSVTFAAGSETVKSGELTVTLNGIDYVYYSEAYTYNDTGIYAKTTLKTANGQYVPAHTMRVKTCLYNSNGQLVKETSLAENSQRTTGFSASCSSGTKGTYYAVGVVQILNGSTWKTYNTLKTGTIKY